MTESLTALADCSNAYDAIVKQMCVDELAPVFGQLEIDEDKQASVVRDALKATGIPGRIVLELQDELVKVQGKIDDFRSRIENRTLPVEDRAQARGMIPFYEAEALNDKLDQAKADLQIADIELNKARDHLGLIQRAKGGCAIAMIDPFNTPAGQATHAYQSYHLPQYVSEIILTGDESSPQWDQAIAQLETLCLVAGYDGPDLNKRERIMARKMWRDYLQKNLTDEVPPSGAEVIRQAHAEVISRTLPQTDRIDDLRGVRIPRNMHVPEHMKVPEVAANVRSDLDTEVRRRIFGGR
jgi:hypothetical protein